MSESSSSPQNSTSTSTSVDTKNLNVSGNTGVTLLSDSGGTSSLTNNTTNRDSGNSLQISTDQGAVQAGRDVAKAGINAATSVTSAAIAASTGLSHAAFDLASADNQRTINFASTTLSTTQDVLAKLSNKFVDAVSGFESQSQSQLGNTVTALNEIAKEQNQSANQLVVQASNDAQQTASNALVQIVRYLALAAVGAIVVKVAFGKKGFA